MNKLIALVGISLTLIVGCSSPSYNYQPNSTMSKTPPINVFSTAYVGESMMESGKYLEYDSIYIPPNTKTKQNLDINTGHHLKVGSDKEGSYYSLKAKENSVIPVSYMQLGATALFVSNSTPEEVCVVAGLYNNRLCGVIPSLKETKVKVYAADSFQQTLLYNGKVGEKVNISYREFKNEMARDAFTNNVEYDLSSSNIIAYKGARLEVIEANNEMIKYKILSYFRLLR